MLMIYFLKLSTILDLNRLARISSPRTHLFHFSNDIHSLNNLSKDDMLSVQPGGLGRTDEELRSVGVGPGIGHGENSSAGMGQLEVLIGEFLTINGLSSSSIAPSEVTTLTHEFWNYSVETASLVSEAFFPSAQCTEVFSRLWNNIGTEFHSNPTGGGTTDGDVEKHFFGDFRLLLPFFWHRWPQHTRPE